MEPQYLLIVKVSKGLVIRDTPRPESQGGRAMRTVAIGTALHAYGIHDIDGVEYARLVPQNPLKQEWVRVAEADHSIEYVDVIELEEDGGLVHVLMELANANILLATALRELARK